jgi:hypothetical protein
MISTKRKNRVSTLSATLFGCFALIIYYQLAYARVTTVMVDEPLIQTNERSVYGAIPEALRQSLIERLNLLIKYRASGQWANLYDLLATSSIKGRSRTQLAEDYRRYPGVAGTGHALVSFLPKTTESNSTDEWTIYGCAKLKGVKVKVDAFIIASQEGGDWHFSDIDMLVPRDTNFRPCGYGSQGAQKRRTR